MLTTKTSSPRGQLGTQALTKTSTPATPPPNTLPAAVSTPSPGSWQHPRLEEITRRQRQNTFDDGNVRKIVWNGLALFVTIYSLSNQTLSPYFFLTNIDPSLQSLTKPLLLILVIILVYNITVALRPLYAPKDELLDIPLTPTQRSLLGLDPNATPPPTQGTRYVTPPRYPRSPMASPATGSAGGSGSRNGSPLIDDNTPSSSPLWQKTRAAAARENIRRRNSGQATPSARGAGWEGRSVLGAPGTPSPIGGRGGGGGASVGLNSKWLYEKGRSSSGSGRSIYS